MTISPLNPKENKTMSKNGLATKTNEISLAGAQSLVASVKDGLKLVSQGYLAITPDVAKLYDCKGFKALGYKNFDEMCALEFGMSHGTTVGIRKVFAKFGSVTNDNKYVIPDKYLEYGYTKLLLFTDKKFEDAGINPIEEFTPEMTINEMRDRLNSVLEDKAKKQDAEAIDTEATEAEATEAETTEAETTEAEATESEANVFDLFESMLSDCGTLRFQLEGKIKKEKFALIDAIEANLKELKKLAK